MTQEQEDHIASAMPPEKRDAVRARLRAATAAGWTSIGIWDSWSEDSRGRMMPNPADEDDLFGVPPGQDIGCQPIP